MEQAALRKAKPTDVFWRGLYGVERDGVDWVVEVDYFDIGEKVCVFRDGIKAGHPRGSRLTPTLRSRHPWRCTA